MDEFLTEGKYLKELNFWHFELNQRSFLLTLEKVGPTVFTSLYSMLVKLDYSHGKHSLVEVNPEIFLSLFLFSPSSDSSSDLLSNNSIRLQLARFLSGFFFLKRAEEKEEAPYLQETTCKCTFVSAGRVQC